MLLIIGWIVCGILGALLGIQLDRDMGGWYGLFGGMIAFGLFFFWWEH